MRSPLFLGLALLLFFSCGRSEQPDNFTGKKIFNIKAAKVIFNVSDITSSGTETLYFDEWGNRAVLVVDRKGPYGNTNQTIIWLNEEAIIIDHLNKLVSRSPFRPKNSEPPAMAEIADSIKLNMGYEKKPDESIAGKDCEVWENKNQNSSYWIWNKLELKTIIPGALKEATVVKKIKEMPSSLLQIPGEYR